MAKVSPFLLGLLLAAGLASPVLAQKAGIYEDLKRGFRLKIPEKWTTVPVQIDEKWIVAKFLSNRTYETKSRDYTDYGEHKPMLQVIEFSDAARKLKVTEEKKGDTTYIDKNAPYRDYKDYLKRNLSEGFYVDKEVQESEGGVACTKFQVKIEKGAQMKKRLVCWVFRAQDGEYAVEAEVLEDHYEKLEPTVLAALKSFKLIPRTQAEPATAVTGGGSGGEMMWTKDRDQWKKLPITERQARRKKIEEERMTAVQKDLPPGWTVKRTKHYLVLSHGDQKFTARLIDAAEAYRGWLEEQFETVTDEYVMQGVIRVCASSDEARAYLKGSGNSDSFNADDREVVTYQDKGEGNAGTDWSNLFMGTMDQYLYDKDALLYRSMPTWLHRALYSVVSSAKMRGGKLVLEPDDWENNAIRDAERANGFLPIKELMGAKAEEEEQDRKKVRGQWAQAARLLRFILGPGSKRPELKNFLISYLQMTVAAAEQIDREERGQVRRSATTEEEEERQAKERKDYWKRHRTEVMNRVTKQQNWSDDTWSSLEKTFYEFLKK